MFNLKLIHYKKIIYYLLNILFIQVCLVNTSLAASCCGSNLSAPMLITTGEKIKMQLNYNFSKKMFQALNKEQIILFEKPQANSQLNMKAGYLFDNQLQLGGQIARSEFGGVGDINISLGQELLSVDQFRNFVWTSLSLPTGLSIEQVSSSSSPTGSGFPILYLGGMITEILPRGDLAISCQLGHGFVNTLKTVNNEKLTILPSQQISFSLSGGFSSGPWRIGSAYQYQWLSGRHIENQNPGLTSYQSTVTVQLSYMQTSQIWSLSYNDDSLIGPAQNAFLQRGFGLSFIDRWFEF